MTPHVANDDGRSDAIRANAPAARARCIPHIDVRDFRRALAKFREGLESRPQPRRKTQEIGQLSPRGAGAALAPPLSEPHVFRAAVLSIVLALAIGPNATLLCSEWCHPDEVNTSACQHRDPSTSPQVTGEDSCRIAPDATTAFVREEGKRVSPTTDALHAFPIVAFRLPPPVTKTSRTSDPSSSLAVGSPQSLTPLRI